MQRVMIIGQPGSGKSTLARMLGERTYLPVHHMDCIQWKAGWRERRQVEKTALVQEIAAREAWIFEGNNTATTHIRIMRADTLIWLDLPLWLRMARVLWRTARYLGRSRPDLPEGCPEQFNREFLSYIWRTRITGRTKLRTIYDDAPEHVTTIRLASARAVGDFLSNLDTARAWGNLGIPHR